MSALTILGLGEMLAHYASYADLAQQVRERFRAAGTTLRGLFARITFDVLVSNLDDHARNHAAFWDGTELELTPAYDICPQQRLGRTAQQAMFIGDERDGFKASEVAGCVERAGLYQLSRADAAEIVDHQIEVITRDWHEVCDAAQLTTAQPEALWGRQFLNPGSLEGWTSPRGSAAAALTREPAPGDAPPSVARACLKAFSERCTAASEAVCACGRALAAVPGSRSVSVFVSRPSATGRRRMPSASTSSSVPTGRSWASPVSSVLRINTASQLAG